MTSVLVYVRKNEVLQTRLKNRNLAATEGSDFFRIFVDTNYLVTEIGDTRSRHKANIACPYHCNTHNPTPILSVLTSPFDRVLFSSALALMTGHPSTRGHNTKEDFACFLLTEIRARITEGNVFLKQAFGRQR